MSEYPTNKFDEYLKGMGKHISLEDKFVEHIKTLRAAATQLLVGDTLGSDKLAARVNYHLSVLEDNKKEWEAFALGLRIAGTLEPIGPQLRLLFIQLLARATLKATGDEASWTAWYDELPAKPVVKNDSDLFVHPQYTQGDKSPILEVARAEFNAMFLKALAGMREQPALFTGADQLEMGWLYGKLPPPSAPVARPKERAVKQPKSSESHKDRFVTPPMWYDGGKFLPEESAAKQNVEEL